MKLGKLFLILAAALLVPALVLADGCPGSTGNWDSNMGLLPGRAVTSNCGGGGLQVGDLLEAQSWDGTTLGSQWIVSGVVLATVAMDYSGIDPVDGSGVIVATTTYTGGMYSMDPSGPWGSAPGSDDLIEGVMDSGFGIIEIHRAPGGITTFVTSQMEGVGHITSCGPLSDCRITYSFGQSQRVWQGDPNSDPGLSDYPAFPGCDGYLPALASQWNMSYVGMGLECTVATDATTWDSLKAQYR